MGQPKLTDVFTEGETDTDRSPSVLSRRSYIDDILIIVTTWTSRYDKVRLLLSVCEWLNLSISLAKRFRGPRKVDYLGHQVSEAGLKAYSKDMKMLFYLPYPTSLLSMQSFLGSLKYSSNVIEDFTILASVLYELRKNKFLEINQMDVGDTTSTKSIKEDSDQTMEKSKERDPLNERTRW